MNVAEVQSKPVEIREEQRRAGQMLLRYCTNHRDQRGEQQSRANVVKVWSKLLGIREEQSRAEQSKANVGKVQRKPAGSKLRKTVTGCGCQRCCELRTFYNFLSAGITHKKILCTTVTVLPYTEQLGYCRLSKAS